MKKIIALLLLMVTLCICSTSCMPKPIPIEPGIDADGVDEPMDIAALDLSEYVVLGDYKGMTVRYDPAKTSKGDAAWAELIRISEIKQYPQDQIAYYFYQKRSGYEHMAKAGGISYESLLESLGITEETILEESYKLTAEDLVFYALIEAEGILITDEDKQAHFEKYVALFVAEYGYTEDYVRKYLESEIYETMLYDKTLEKLISFVVFEEIVTEE